MKKPLYNSSPLPFMGQKRRFVGQFRKALGQFPDAELFVDLFGGSGLLSHIAKQERPEARVVYNDYDDFHLRMENIPRTNALLADIRNLVGAGPKGLRLPEPLRRQILDRVAQEETTGFVDYITLSASLLFSGNYATSFEELAVQQFYNMVRQSDYAAEGYLAGVEIVKHDYRELFGLFQNRPGVVFLIDPPYLSTEAGTYKCYWKLADYLDVLQCLQGQSYVYFTSTKSQVLEFAEWLKRSKYDCNPFDEALRTECVVTINKDAKYTDIMIYKRA